MNTQVPAIWWRWLLGVSLITVLFGALMVVALHLIPTARVLHRRTGACA